YYSILGFLTTAIPRFTETDYLRPKELALFTLQMLGLLIVLLFENAEGPFWLFLSIGWVLFIWFGSNRFLNRKQNPPFSFIFVAIGVVCGLLGTTCLSLFYFGLTHSTIVLTLGKISFFDTMTLAFIIGVGSRLIPGILGFQEIVKSQRDIYEKKEAFLVLVPKLIYLLAILFITSIVLEVLENFTYAFLLRALIVSYVSFKYWGIHKKPAKRTWHSFFIFVAAYLILLASWLLVFLEETIAIKHLLYIGSYTLLTFMIASRVILAHSSSGLDLEKRFNPYAILGILFVAAAATRATANYFPEIYISHLGYAGLTLFIALSFWGFIFIPKIFGVFRRQS
ncbi:MAG: NnrS family protein, partial [Oligoflexales bacterium]|nr:NnrS family protein [Oligoflexales bacterium]